MLLLSAASSQISTRQRQNCSQSLTVTSGEEQYLKQMLDPATHRMGKLLSCFTGAEGREVQHLPPSPASGYGAPPLCASSSSPHPSKGRLNSPRQTGKNTVNLVLLLYSPNGLIEGAPTLAQGRGGRISIPLPLGSNKQAGSAEHGAATEESTSRPLQNQLDGQEEGWHGS